MKTTGKNKGHAARKHEPLMPERSAIVSNSEIVNETYRRADDVHRAAEELHNTIRKVEDNVSNLKVRHAKPAASATSPESQSRGRKPHAKRDASR